MGVNLNNNDDNNNTKPKYLDTNEFIKKVNQPYYYPYVSKVEYINEHSKAIIVCETSR